MSDPRDAFDREEVALEQRLTSGELSLAEYNEEMRALGRDYQQMAEEAAQGAYDRERDQW